MPARLRQWCAALFLVCLVVPSVASAATVSEFNPICWKEKDCNATRAQFLRKTADQLTLQEKDGWVQDQAACPGQDWGKCLPAGTSVTEISFGGRNQFLHLGDFIQSMYKYAIGIAGILAAVVIIVAGFQWVLAGGNAESIATAKHRISGALIGLIIAYLSYAILNTLNPALVNLRLPQIWMVRPQALVPEFCSTAPTSTAFAFAADTNDQTSVLPAATSSLVYNLTVFGDPKTDTLNKDWKEDTFYCGKRFYVKGGDSNDMCFGDYCPSGQTCVDFAYQGKDPKKKFTCFPGKLAGNIFGQNPVGTNLAEAGNNVKLFSFCKDGTSKELQDVDSETSDSGNVIYSLKDLGETTSACGTPDNLLGFYLGVEVNDSPGEDDWYAIGQSQVGSHVCDTNISKLAFTATYKSTPQCNFVECTCSFLAPDGIRKDLANLVQSGDGAAQVFVKHLITPKELDRGYQCNIVLNRSEFPGADNDVLRRVIRGAGAGAAVAAGTLVTGGATLGASFATWIVAPGVVATGGTFLGAMSALGFSDPTACN